MNIVLLTLLVGSAASSDGAFETKKPWEAGGDSRSSVACVYSEIRM